MEKISHEEIPAVTEPFRFCCGWYNSAKTAEVNEITPQTNYVWVHYNGRCSWTPRFELSASHCTVDVTWFPFDVQRCQLVFESWVLFDDQLNVTVNDDRSFLESYLPSEEWNLTCAWNWSAGILVIINCKLHLLIQTNVQGRLSTLPLLSCR